jgi:DNA-binding response OmpR family regulator
MTKVVNLYINYLRRNVDVGFEVALIPTVREVGYQMGANVAPV